MPLRPFQKVHIAKDAVIPEKVLILQITAAAPFSDKDTQGVGSRPHCCGEIEFRLQVRTLRLPDEVIIQNHLSAGGYALQHQIDAGKIACILEISFIDAQGIDIRHIRRIKGIRIVDIGVIGGIISI